MTTAATPSQNRKVSKRKLDIRTREQCVAEIERLASGPYDTAGSWSLGQVCQHLALSIDATIACLPLRRFLWARLLGPPAKWWVFRTRSIGIRVPSPARVRPQNSADDQRWAAAAIEAFHRLENFEGPFTVHPIFGPLTSEEWHDFHLFHAAHHLGFIVPRRSRDGEAPSEQEMQMR